MTTSVDFRELITSASTAGSAETARGVVEDYVVARRKLRKQKLTTATRKTLVSELRQAFLVRWLSRKFSTLDTSFCAKTRHVLLCRDDAGVVRVEKFDYAGTEELDVTRQIVVEIPAYAQVTRDEILGTNHTLSINNVGMFSRRYKPPQAAAVRVRAAVTCPTGIGIRHRRLANRFLAEYLRGIAELLSLGSPLPRYGYQIRSDIAYGVIWAPQDDTWAFMESPLEPKGDPAVVAVYGDTTFLLDVFDTPKEKPISNIVREFSSGKLRKSKK